MKKRLATGLIGGILAVGFVGAIHAGDKHEGHKHAEVKPQCGKPAEAAVKACASPCKAPCNATVEVTNTDNGVVVKMTASTPEDVKKVQECWANRAACKAAASEKAPAACGSKKKGGTCPGKKAE